jgi:hypothetical protein
VTRRHNCVPRLCLEGHTLDIPQEAAVTWAIGTIVGPLEIVSGVHWALAFAMPRSASTEFLKILVRITSSLRQNAGIVDDGLLLQSINEALPPLESFILAAEDLREWEGANVSRSRRRSHTEATRERGPLDPHWAAEAGYQERLAILSHAFSSYVDALSRIIPRLRGMLPPSSPESASMQLDTVEKQLPDIRNILSLGYREATRRKATERGYTPSA